MLVAAVTAGTSSTTESSPGCPLGALKFTVMPSNCSPTGAPSHSSTRGRDPEMSIWATEMSPGSALGSTSGVETHFMNQGSCGSDIVPRMPICSHSRSRPSGK